jgi:8-oxo-dGTP diphosphatase
MPSKTSIAVVAAAIFNQQGQVLLAKRPVHLHQGGLWEFPGGKLQAGESAFQALARELNEELGITPRAAKPLIRIKHQYPDKAVCLDVYRVTDFEGVALGKEGQQVQWVSVADLGLFEFPAANRSIVKALQLPRTLTISGDALNPADWLARLSGVVERGDKWFLLRPGPAGVAQLLPSLPRIRAMCREAQVMPVFHCDLLPHLTADDLASGGLHLSVKEGLRLQQRPEVANLSMSCHNPVEIQHAQALGADWLFLSPVKATTSHPEAQVLGWQGFAEGCSEAVVPVYALGGLHPSDADHACELGGQGVAGISAFWPTATT